MRKLQAIGAAIVAVMAFGAVAATDKGTAVDPPTAKRHAPADLGVDVSRRTERGWSECEHVEPDRRPLSGGCLFKTVGGARLRLVTPFGGMALARCDLYFDLRIGPSGDVAMGELGRIGPSPCADIRSCDRDIDAGTPPWPGQIETDGRGGFVMILEACLDTCVGWFDGPLTLPLEHTANGWKLEADRAMVGQSGFVVRGEWWLDGPPLRIVADRDAINP